MKYLFFNYVSSVILPLTLKKPVHIVLELMHSIKAATSYLIVLEHFHCGPYNF